MDRWEYTSIKTVKNGGFFDNSLKIEELNSKLNELGEQGWELVSCFTTNEYHGETNEIISVLKRRK